MDPLAAAHRAYEDGNITEALELARGVAAAGGADADAVFDARMLEGECLLVLDRPGEALALLDGLGAEDAREPVAQALRGDTLYRMWRFKDALAPLRAAVRAMPDDPASHRALACCLDRTGDRKAADEHFRTARDLEPEAFPLPVRMTPAAFDQVAREALAELPAEVAVHVRGLEVVTHDYPRLGMLGGEVRENDPGVLGLFWAEAVPDRYEEIPPGFTPGQILLFQRNIEAIVATEEELVEQIRITVFHEVGHLIGFDEDGLDALGLA
jgi:predicted Zn-dependent protease with MMP-like domain